MFRIPFRASEATLLLSEGKQELVSIRNLAFSAD
jgi:hypothetical protein